MTPDDPKNLSKTLISIFDGLAFVGFIVDLGRLVGLIVTFIFSFFP
jgi:hypothetical protein